MSPNPSSAHEFPIPLLWNSKPCAATLDGPFLTIAPPSGHDSELRAVSVPVESIVCVSNAADETLRLVFVEHVTGRPGEEEAPSVKATVIAGISDVRPGPSSLAAFFSERGLLVKDRPSRSLDVHVIANPRAGGGKADTVVEQAVKPLFEATGFDYTVHRTAHPNHAEDIARESLPAPGAAASQLFVLLGGDGTTHELLNGLLSRKSSAQSDQEAAATSCSVALIPCGTANALFEATYPGESRSFGQLESLVRAVRGVLLGRASEHPLSLAEVRTFVDRERTQPDKRSHAQVVVSTCLHAAILRDSDLLRDEIPGIDRFKVAAERNMSKWWGGRLRLLSSPGAPSILQYDIETKAFRPTTTPESHILEGPFSYFVSVTVDRLEPTFVVAPLRVPGSPPDSIDLVVIRPGRDPSIHSSATAKGDEETRGKFILTLAAATQGMYSGGEHVNLRYGEAVNDDAGRQGPPIVEYYRAAGYVWEPTDDYTPGKLLCVDGVVDEVSGAVECRAVENSSINIWL